VAVVEAGLQDRREDPLIEMVFLDVGIQGKKMPGLDERKRIARARRHDNIRAFPGQYGHANLPVATR